MHFAEPTGLDDKRILVFYSLCSEIGTTFREFKLVAPMPEQINHYIAFIYMPPDTSGKCVLVVPISFGVGATEFKFWVLTS